MVNESRKEKKNRAHQRESGVVNVVSLPSWSKEMAEQKEKAGERSKGSTRR